MKWAAASSGANFSLLNSGGTALTGAATVTVSGISGANKILILVAGASSDVAGDAIRVRFNTDTANNYTTNAIYNQPGTSYNVSDYSFINTQATSSFLIAQIRNNASGVMSGYLLADGCNSSGLKVATFAGSGAEGSATAGSQVVGGGTYSGSSTISSISVNAASGNLDAGTVYVYTSA